MLTGKKILIGVSGSIAAYKAAYLVRLLVKNGAEVRVITTDAARKFVTDLTFSNLSKNAVFHDLWGGTWTEHIHWGGWADLFIVAPATANTLAKFAHGLSDNALTAVYLGATCPVWVAPAMDADMFRHPQTQANLTHLQAQGVHIIPSGKGEHASGLMGPGRLAEPEEILEAIQGHFSDGPLSGKKVLITAGPTAEAIDPVRYITNRSTGKMGYALAAVAHELGAEVTLISGPVALDNPLPHPIVSIRSAADLYEATVSRAGEQDIVIMAAAVADYTPAVTSDKKIKKKEGDLAIELVRTKDILKQIGSAKKTGQLFVGFALETHQELENAERKLKSKNLDFIVLNSLKDKGAGFGHDTNKITILDNNGGIIRYPLVSKTETARNIFNRILSSGNHEKNS